MTQAKQAKQAKSMKFRTHAWMIVAGLAAGTILLGAATHRRTDASAGGGGTTHLTASADSGVSLSGHLDRTAVLKDDDGRVHLELILGAETLPDTESPRVPTDLVVVLDRSGSMQGEKIRQARAAIHQLISQLEPDDRFGLVAFSSNAEVAIPLTLAAPAASGGWTATVASLSAGGGTFMAPALDLGLGLIERSRQAGRSPRVMLLSDGLAAETPIALRGLASRAARGEFTLSTVGIGADFDESMMSTLADAGTGNYYYLHDLAQLSEIFHDEFETARSTVATGLEVRLAPADGIQVLDAAGYPLERSGNEVRFRPGILYSGQERRVWVTLQVPTDRVLDRSLGSIRLAFTRDGERRQLSLDDLPRIATVEKRDDFLAALDAERWAQAVVVEGYGDLRQEVSRYVQQGRHDEAKRALGRFRASNASIQADAQSPEVDRILEDAAELEASVDGAFAAPDAPAARNQLGKKLHSESVLERRPGDRI